MKKIISFIYLAVSLNAFAANETTKPVAKEKTIAAKPVAISEKFAIIRSGNAISKLLTQAVVKSIEDANKTNENYKLQSVLFDDTCDVKKGVEVANKIVKDKIPVVFGSVCSGVTKEIAPIFAKAGIIHLSPLASFPDQKGDDNSFYMLDSQNLGSVLYNFVYKNPNAKVALIKHGDFDNFSSVNFISLKEMMRANNKVETFQIAGFSEKTSTAEIDSIIKRLQEEKIDTIILNTNYKEATKLIQALAKANLNIKIVAPDTSFSLASNAKDAAYKAYTQNIAFTSFENINNAATETLIATIKKEAGDKSTETPPTLLRSYLAPLFIIKTQEELKKPIAGNLKDYIDKLKTMSYKTDIGDFKFLANKSLETKFILNSFNEQGKVVPAVR